MTPSAPPTLDDLTEARDLPRAIIARAVERWGETTARAERARDLAELDRRLDKWAEHAGGLAVDAERDLVRAILTVAGDFDRHPSVYPEKLDWPEIGVTLGSTVYLVVPDPDRVGEPRNDGPDRMTLVVVGRDAIHDMTGGHDIATFNPRKAS